MDNEESPLIRFGREVCGDLPQAERREWWLANGRGAYAAGTVAGTLTRRYHGLLVAPVNPPLGRHLVVAKADATLTLDGHEWPLHTNRWSSGVVAPEGYLNVESFHLDGRIPVWRHACGGATLESRIWMEPGRHTTYVAWRRLTKAAAGSDGGILRVRLLVNARDHHGTARPWSFNPVIENEGGWVRVRQPHGFALHLGVRGGSLETRHDWHENFDLPVERERGLDDRDHHLCVAEATLRLAGEDWVGIVVSLEDDASPYLGEALRRARAEDAGHRKRAKVQVPELARAPAWVSQLALAASSFVFDRPLPDVPDGESVIAGYPWFGDWGRDTMIALPGLTLATGRYETARRVLRTFARFVDRGMLPNVFPGAGERPEYNTVDAALWYIEAWRAYVDATGDGAALKEVYPTLVEIVRCHVEGTRHGIGVDPADGLLRAGEPGVQLTWMDAKIGDWVVTPRSGKPVEVNALWYNGLVILGDFAQRLGLPRDEYDARAAQARAGFQRFADDASGGLHDVIDGPSGIDASIRPNQILAVSLPHSPIGADRQAGVIRVCARELLGTYGLRSLTPRDAAYRPRYGGGVWERDSAYHQGTVWSWLLGHFALAEYRVHGDALAAQARLEPLRDHLLDAGLGTVSEIFDGDPPHRPGGAPAQAWSVACALEAWWRLERERRRVASTDAHVSAASAAKAA